MIPYIFAAAILLTKDVSGIVIDATGGLPVQGAIVRVCDAKDTVATDERGAFRIATAQGSRPTCLAISRDGYQPSIATDLGSDSESNIVLALQRAPGNLHVIAATTTRASGSLQQSSTFTQMVNTEALLRTGRIRAADVLRTLPGVNNGINGDTAALGDDVNLSIRGIGTLETVATLDGHPIGYGIKGGYNYQLSPVFPYRSIAVLYGSGGSNILGVNAIGGVVNFSTLEPTPQAHFIFTQGFGTFDRLASSFSATGSQGRLGYALSYGTSGLDGPFHSDTFYQPSAAYDASAPVGSSIHNLGIYTDDAGVVSRGGLAKIRYNFDNRTALTFTDVASSYWENKTGNGDGDYLSMTPALAFGQHLLNAYSPPAKPSATNPICPAGTFRATNANGAPNGFGPGNVPDGGVTCQTPQQWAQFNSGWQGAGPAWQAFNFNDEHLGFERRGDRATLTVEGFTSRYDDITSRLDQLPFKATPGDAGKLSVSQVTSTGALIGEQFNGANNDLELGYNYLNNVYLYETTKAAKSTFTFPFSTETAFLVREVYHPHAAPLTAFLNMWAKHATATNTSYIDPRISIIDRLGTRDVARFALGATTTQPSSDQLNQPFVEGSLGGAGGGSDITCAGLNSIGSAPSSALRPERGVDEEFAYGHRWSNDSLSQVEVYNVNVYDKLYASIAPLSQTGTGFIDPAFLAAVSAQVSSKCGTSNPLGLMGVTGTVNVGTLRASGIDLSGRQRLTRHLDFDYNWSLASTIIRNAPAALLQSNLSLILGSQLPRVPLHTFDGSLDATIGRAFDARYSFHAVSANNTKGLPAYNYSDLSVSYIASRNSTLNISVGNLFNQWASIAGLQYQGVPLALNSYATAAAYLPYTGAAATEQFGLPYRSIYVSYQFAR